MSLLDALKTQVLDVLVPYGWASLFKKHGLDITVASKKLADELTRVLPIQRMISGFQDFALGGYRAIEPGRPGLSLLYHALASAHVNPGTSNSCEMPTLEQMEIVENYIYSVANRTIASFNDPVIAVFAYQYRDADHTTHRQHADLAFSRTGIARVGNLEYEYNPLIRGFDPKPAKDESGFRALPARYGVFIAERRPQPPDGSVMRGVMLDGSLTFLFPVHKLFEGDECLFSQNEDGTLKPIRIPKLKYCERHVNEKLAKIHLPQDGQNPGYVVPMSKPKFDLTKPPFVRDSAKGDRFVTLKSVGSSVLVVPVHQPLAETATQRVDGVDELVRFRVPKRMDVTVGGRSNRYWSTFELPATSAGRAAPEYANIRQEVVKQGKADFTRRSICRCWRTKSSSCRMSSRNSA